MNLENTALITEWTSSILENVYKLQREKKLKNTRKNQSIVTLAGKTDQRVLNKSFCGPCFRSFELYGQEYARIFWLSVIPINAQGPLFFKVEFKFYNDEVT